MYSLCLISVLSVYTPNDVINEGRCALLHKSTSALALPIPQRTFFRCWGVLVDNGRGCRLVTPAHRSFAPSVRTFPSRGSNVVVTFL